MSKENIIVDTPDTNTSSQSNTQRKTKEKQHSQKEATYHASEQTLPQTGVNNHAASLGVFTISGLILMGLLIGKKLIKGDED